MLGGFIDRTLLGETFLVAARFAVERKLLAVGLAFRFVIFPRAGFEALRAFPRAADFPFRTVARLLPLAIMAPLYVPETFPVSLSARLLHKS